MSEIMLQAMEKLQRERDELRRETIEQCRLLGMGGERELKLIEEVERLKRELNEARTQEKWHFDNYVFAQKEYLKLREQRVSSISNELADAKRELDNATSDAKQSEVDAIRALHERNEAREQRDRLAEALEYVVDDLDVEIRGRIGHSGKWCSLITAREALAAAKGGTP
jgi:chaperonin GroEL (HSP60 family)